MTFDKVYSEFQSTDIEELKGRFPEMMENIFQHSDIDNLGHHVMQFVMGTIHGDGVFDKAEYELIQPLMLRICKLTYEQACEIFNNAQFDEADVAMSRKRFKEFPEEVRDNLTMICLVVAAVDGNIDDRELEWIKAFAL